jgi:hypothetical protein
MTDATGDIVQIIPADRWWALYQHDGRTERHPLIAWGLTDSGTVIGLVECDDPQPVSVTAVAYDQDLRRLLPLRPDRLHAPDQGQRQDLR